MEVRVSKRVILERKDCNVTSSHPKVKNSVSLNMHLRFEALISMLILTGSVSSEVYFI